MAILLLPPPNTDSDSGSESVDDAASVWSGSSDTSSDVTEVDQDEIPHYFIERNGRLFHHHGNAPYPLPVDAEEQHVRGASVRYSKLPDLTSLCHDPEDHWATRLTPAIAGQRL